MEYETQHQIDVMYTEEQINQKICELGEQISRDYAGKSIHLICVLKGGACFMTELAKRITVPVSMDFMCVSSYGDGMTSSGCITISQDLTIDIKNREVIIIEDIVDSGRTLSYLVHMLKKREPASLKICSMLDKPDRRESQVVVDFTGFEIEDHFVVGFGLDYAQRYRNLPYIGVLRLEEA